MCGTRGASIAEEYNGFLLVRDDAKQQDPPPHWAGS